MSKELPVLKVTMLGRFSVSWGEKDIAFKRTTSTKALQLFQILLYTKETGIQRTRLLDYLYSRDELADMANNLRVRQGCIFLFYLRSFMILQLRKKLRVRFFVLISTESDNLFC